MNKNKIHQHLTLYSVDSNSNWQRVDAHSKAILNFSLLDLREWEGWWMLKNSWKIFVEESHWSSGEQELIASLYSTLLLTGSQLRSNNRGVLCCFCDFLETSPAALFLGFWRRGSPVRWQFGCRLCQRWPRWCLEHACGSCDFSLYSVFASDKMNVPDRWEETTVPFSHKSPASLNWLYKQWNVSFTSRCSHGIPYACLPMLVLFWLFHPL